MSTHPDQYVITIRIRLATDHRLVGQPEVLTNSGGPLFEAIRDSAVRAVLQAQPYDMLSQSTYDKWKEIDINFDPREVVARAVRNSQLSPCASAAGRPSFYTEYLPNWGFDCEKPLLNTLNPWSSLEACEGMYKANYFVEFTCEGEALFKQRTAPHLLVQSEIKWLSNVANRRRACIGLLAEKGKLSVWDKISRWWTTKEP